MLEEVLCSLCLILYTKSRSVQLQLNCERLAMTVVCAELHEYSVIFESVKCYRELSNSLIALNLL